MSAPLALQALSLRRRHPVLHNKQTHAAAAAAAAAAAH